MNKSWKLKVFAAAASALDKWEPRIKLEKVSIDAVSAGKAAITVQYKIKETSEESSSTVTVTRGGE